MTRLLACAATEISKPGAFPQDGYSTATETATKVRNSAGHTVIMVCKAFGV